MTEPIFHVAVESEWLAARTTGDYPGSHAAYEAQVPGVLTRFYAGVEDELVLLVIDPTRLRVPVKDVVDPDSGEAFPRILGPINRGAVVEVRRVHAVPQRDDLRGGGDAGGAPDRRLLLAIAGLLVCIVIGVLIGLAIAH